MKQGRTLKQKAKDFLTLPVRSLAVLYQDRWGLSSLASERYDYVAREVRGYCLDMGCGPANEFVNDYLDGDGDGIQQPRSHQAEAGSHPVLDFGDCTFETVTLIANINRMPGTLRDAQLAEAIAASSPVGTSS